MSGTYRFRLERQRLTLAGLRAPLRVALLSDLHFGPFIRAGSLRRWVDATLRQRPDLILLGGDMVDHWAGDDLTPLLRELARLEAPLGVYAVWGNHDHAALRRRGGRAAMDDFACRLRRDAGVRLLRNASCRPRDDLRLAGIDDLLAGHPDVTAALADAGAAAGAPPATLLLSHNPDVIPELPEEIGLTLSGHTHGGQVRVPGYGAVFTGSSHGRAFAAGWVPGPRRGYVTRGLGVSGAPLRFACPAELTLFDLEPGEPVAGRPTSDRPASDRPTRGAASA